MVVDFVAFTTDHVQTDIDLFTGRAGQFEEDPEVTVRGPVSYAGPGSLGGVDSALKPR